MSPWVYGVRSAADRHLGTGQETRPLQRGPAAHPLACLGRRDSIHSRMGFRLLKIVSTISLRNLVKPVWSVPRSWPHDDVRVGCLNVCNDIPSRQPTQQARRNPSPGGDGTGISQPCDFRRVFPVRQSPALLERGALDPDAVQNDGAFAGDGDLRLLHAIAFGKSNPSRASAPTNAAFDAVAHWLPRRDRFPAGGQPI